MEKAQGPPANEGGCNDSLDLAGRVFPLKVLAYLGYFEHLIGLFDDSESDSREQMVNQMRYSKPVCLESFVYVASADNHGKSH